MYQFLEL